MSQYVERHQEVVSDSGFLRRINETVIIKLRRCPFCGEKAHAQAAYNEDGEEKQIIKCSKCGAQTEMYDELEEAVDAWNMRV